MPQVNIGGVSLHYVQVMHESGIPDSPNLLMVHGLGANLGFWYFAYSRFLAKYFRVTLVDLRGHGRSGMPREGYGAAQMATDVAGLLDALGVETTHLIGHSFGGAVLAHFACMYPERVCSLTLVDTRLRALQASRTPARTGNEAGWKVLEKMARRRVSQPPEEEKMLTLFAGEGGMRTARRWLQLLDTTSARADFSKGDDLMPAALAKITAPVLAIYGERSPALPSGYAIQDRIPQARLVIVADAGHFFPLNRREALISALNNFFSEILAPAT